MSRDKITNILNKTWHPEKGDYIRDKYEYDKSHEEIVKKEKLVRKIANILFFLFTLITIISILHLMTSV